MTAKSVYAGLGPPTDIDQFNISGRIPERVYETRISHFLGPSKSWYSTVLGRLYFWDASEKPVAATVTAVLASRGIRRPPVPFGMDVHGYFRGVNRIDLSAEEFRPVHMALRLLEVTVVMDDTPVLNNAEAAGPPAPVRNPPPKTG